MAGARREVTRTVRYAAVAWGGAFVVRAGGRARRQNARATISPARERGDHDNVVAAPHLPRARRPIPRRQFMGDPIDQAKKFMRKSGRLRTP